MKVFIAGATGVLGRRCVSQFASAGHDVVGLTRDRSGDKRVREAGGTPERGDIFEKDTLVDAAADADIVVHAASALPTKTKTSAEDWEKNDQVRITGTRDLLDVADEVGADQFLTHSVVWAVRAPDGSEIDEESTPNTDRTTESAIKMENITRERAQEESFTATILRYGWFYGPESGQTRQIGENLTDGDLPVIGSGLLGRGETTISLTHTIDAGRAMVAAAESGIEGVYHVVDDEPVTTREFFTEFAAQLDADEPSTVPPWLAKMFVGKDMVRFMTNSFPTSNERFKDVTDWEPRYPTYRQGIHQIVTTWESEGDIVASPKATAD